MKQKSIIFSVISIIFIVLLVISLFNSLNSDESLRFSSFLEILQNAPEFTIEPINISISSDWGIFDFLRIFVNQFLGAVSFSLWLIQSVWNMFKFIGYFLFGFIRVSIGV